MVVLIPNNLLGNISCYSIAIYSVLQFLATSTGIQNQFVTTQQLSYLLNNKFKQPRRMTDFIEKGICELVDKKIVNIIESEKKCYVLNCENLWLKTNTDRFTIIYFDEIQKIFEINDVNNFKLFQYFIYLMYSISSSITVFINGDSKSHVIGTYTIENLSNMSGISFRSVVDYNKILEENNLVYIHRQNDFVIDDNGNIKTLGNIYGRFLDKEWIDEFANNQAKYQKSYQYQKKSVEKVNDNRRLAQMYQQLLKGNGESYSESQIKDIYNYVLSENKKYERLYEKNNWDSYLDKIRDVDIFEKYEFLKKYFFKKEN